MTIANRSSRLLLSLIWVSALALSVGLLWVAGYASAVSDPEPPETVAALTNAFVEDPGDGNGWAVTVEISHLVSVDDDVNTDYVTYVTFADTTGAESPPTNATNNAGCTATVDRPGWCEATFHVFRENAFTGVDTSDELGFLNVWMTAKNASVPQEGFASCRVHISPFHGRFSNAMGGLGSTSGCGSAQIIGSNGVSATVTQKAEGSSFGQIEVRAFLSPDDPGLNDSAAFQYVLWGRLDRSDETGIPRVLVVNMTPIGDNVVRGIVPVRSSSLAEFMVESADNRTSRSHRFSCVVVVDPLTTGATDSCGIFAGTPDVGNVTGIGTVPTGGGLPLVNMSQVADAMGISLANAQLFIVFVLAIGAFVTGAKVGGFGTGFVLTGAWLGTSLVLGLLPVWLSVVAFTGVAALVVLALARRNGGV